MLGGPARKSASARPKIYGSRSDRPQGHHLVAFFSFIFRDLRARGRAREVDPGWTLADPGTIPPGQIPSHFPHVSLDPDLPAGSSGGSAARTSRGHGQIHTGTKFHSEYTTLATFLTDRQLRPRSSQIHPGRSTTRSTTRSGSADPRPFRCLHLWSTTYSTGNGIAVPAADNGRSEYGVDSAPRAGL